MLRSEIKHLASAESTQEVGENARLYVSLNTSFVLTSLAACFISERSTLEAGLFVKYVYKFSSTREKIDV